MINADVTIIGAGPAGSALALSLAPRHRVVLVDKQAEPTARIGESLVPAARRLLRDMRILEAFEQDGHPPYYGNLSYWGAGEPQRTDFMQDPEGPGWHLDRARFERFLRRAAIQRGAEMIAPAKLGALQPSGPGWDIMVTGGHTETEIRSRLLVDATGRSAVVVKRLGMPRQQTDHLVAHWLRGEVTQENRDTAGFSVIESEREGWWYSAPLANGGRVLAFHTDADIIGAEERHVDALLARARELPGVGGMLRQVGFQPITASVATTAANSAFLAHPVGENWLAIGDAAASFDPITSRGLFNGLYTAWTGAMLCHEVLTGAAANFAAYAQDLTRIRLTYDRHLAVVYGAESRWTSEQFWRARATGA